MNSAPLIYVITGEASGDMHASNLLRALLHKNNTLRFEAWAGEQCQDAGATLIKHYNELSFMGFWEVIQNLGTIRANFDFCKKELQTKKPDLLLLVDFSGFNLRVAKFAKSIGLKVCYYISPQVWASRSSRVHDIHKYTDLLLTILPFEQAFYDKFGYEVAYVGHPLLDVIARHRPSVNFETQEKLIALLPGSRRQEIRMMLPIMLELAKRHPSWSFKVAMAPAREDAFYEQLMNVKLPNVTFVRNQTYDLLHAADAACVTSGTATLETALFDTPQIVCYKANAISYWIARQIIKVKYISLVNLIMDKQVVKELIQHDLTVGKLENELLDLLDHPEPMLKEYAALKKILGNAGASAKAADLILERFDL